MELKLSFYDALCSTEHFEINGIDADYEDFGEKYDRDPEGAQDYCCGNMEFTRVAPNPKILEKYKITEAEYSSICDELTEGLSFGECCWCE